MSDLWLRLLGAFCAGFAVASIYWSARLHLWTEQQKKRYDELSAALKGGRDE